MYHYRCNDCGHIWYTSLMTTRCNDPMCLQYNISEISKSPQCTYKYFNHAFWKEGQKWAEELDKLGEPIRKRLSEWLDYIKNQEEESSNE